jgi:hypothetical protein
LKKVKAYKSTNKRKTEAGIKQEIENVTEI